MTKAEIVKALSICSIAVTDGNAALKMFDDGKEPEDWRKQIYVATVGEVLNALPPDLHRYLHGAVHAATVIQKEVPARYGVLLVVAALERIQKQLTGRATTEDLSS